MDMNLLQKLLLVYRQCKKRVTLRWKKPTVLNFNLIDSPPLPKKPENPDKSHHPIDDPNPSTPPQDLHRDEESLDAALAKYIRFQAQIFSNR